MEILIASGCFKDVFNPIESCDMLEKVINYKKYNITKMPLCDGGEYTYDILNKFFHLNECVVNNIKNSYGKLVTAKYLVSNNEAHIVASEIIRLYPHEDNYKNPLELTDYGLGQLVKDAIEKGFTNINIYIGGTSTVGGGMGFAQALGAEIKGLEGGFYSNPIKGKDLNEITSIKSVKEYYSDINVKVIVDGNAKSTEMSGITRLKVSRNFNTQEKEYIIDQTNKGIQNIVKITKLNKYKDFTGAAGGLVLGIEQVFNAKYILGGEFFNKRLGLDLAIKNSDIIITGEGRFDNTMCGKIPAYVASIAQKYRKKVILVCGQIENKYYKKRGQEIIDVENDLRFKGTGISKIVTCQEYYNRHPVVGTEEECIEMYRKLTPKILSNILKRGVLDGLI